jgi:hypothetical protein
VSIASVRLAPYVVLAGAMGLAFALYATLVASVAGPRVFLDELIYLDAANALADGQGLAVRGDAYHFAPLYPMILSPLFALLDRETAYEAARLVNVVLFVLAAVPIYLLARRVLPRWSSVVAAALALAIPSTMYASVVMSESLGYALACTAMLAVVLAVERPTVGRQAGALGVMTLAFLARPQFVVLFVAYGLALLLAPSVLGRGRSKLRCSIRRFWPSLGFATLALAAVVARWIAAGEPPSSALGAYSALWDTYSPLAVARQLVYEGGLLLLYVGVIPVVVSVVAISSLLRHGRSGSPPHAALALLFLFVNSGALLVAALFDTTEHSLGRLHDRYVFYVAPLWFVLLLAWVHEGAPRPRIAAAAGAILALALGLSFPASVFDIDDGGQLFDGVATTTWAALAEIAGDPGTGTLVATVVTVVLVLAVLTFLLPRRLAVIAPSLVAVWLVVAVAFTWASASEAARDRRAEWYVPGESRAWVDDSVPADASVALLYVSCERAVSLGRWQRTVNSLLQTEFFNASVGRVLNVGGNDESTIRVDRSGAIRLRDSGREVSAGYVVAQPGAPVIGERVALGTAARLVLWRVAGTLRLGGTSSTAELAARTCGAEGGRR